MERDTLFDLIPAYALGALDDNERVQVEALLDADAEARARLVEYEAVAAQLVALAPLHPAPDHLRDDLRERLAARQTVFRRSSGMSRTALRYALGAAAAVMLVVAGVLAALVLFGEDEPAPDDVVARYAALVEREAAQHYTVVPGEVDDAISGELVATAAGDEAIIRVEGLPALSEDEVFQLWLVDQEGARTSGGLFHGDTADGATYIEVPLADSLPTYQAFGVSLEPAGGSPYDDRPTGPRVFLVPLNS